MLGQERKGLRCRNTDPLLPALIEGLGLVHAVSVAIVSAVPVPKVSVLVAKVSTASTSLLKLYERRCRKRNYNLFIIPLNIKGNDAT